MRLIILLLGMGIHILTIGFTSSSSTIEDDISIQIKSSMSQKDVVTGTGIKRSPSKRAKFFLVCTKEEDESLKCKPVSHTIEKEESSPHKNYKKKTKYHHKSKRKKSLLHNITNESLNLSGEQISANAITNISGSVSQNDTLDQKKFMNHIAPSSATIKTTEVVRLDKVNISNSKNHNVGLDLNVIMSSVMARRHEYLQQQIEDGILDSSYEPSGDDDLEDDDVDNGLIDMRKLHTTHSMSSIVASDKNNMMGNNRVLTQIVPNNVQDKSTPLLKETPTGVQSNYEGKQFSDVNVQKFSTSTSKDIKKLITPTNVKIISEIHRSRTSISETTKNETTPVIQTDKSNSNKSKNDFYKIEFGSENDTDIMVTKDLPKGRDRYRIFEYNSFNAKEDMARTTLIYLGDIRTSLYLSTIKSSPVNSIKVSSSTSMEYTKIDGINGLFETGMEYYPIPLGKAEALLFSPASVTSNIESTSIYQTSSHLVSKMDSTSVKSTSTNFVTRYFTPASMIVDEFECVPYEDKGTVFDFDPIESRKQNLNPAPAKSNDHGVYDEFVSAYQKVSGNAEIDLTEDTDDMLSSNIAHEENPDFIPALNEYNKDEEQTYGSWPSLVKSSNQEQGYSNRYNVVGNSSKTSPLPGSFSVDDAKRKTVTHKDDFFLLKRNDILVPEPAISKASRRCHPKQFKSVMIDNIRTSVIPLYGSTNGFYMASSNSRVRTESALATISSPSSVGTAINITPTLSSLIKAEQSPVENSSTRGTTPTKPIRKIIISYHPTETRLPDLIAKIKSLSSNPRPPTTKSNTVMNNTTRLRQIENYYASSPTTASTLGEKTTDKGSASWTYYGPDSTSREICGKNFLIQMKLPPEVHRYSKTEIKQKIEDAISVLYRLHDSFQSSKVVWVDDVSSDIGPAVGVDVELYFTNKGCKHLYLLQSKLKKGWMGELALSSDGIMYALLDDRIADSSICRMPCSNPYNCFPTCNKECCENPLLIKVPPSPKSLKKMPNRPTKFDPRNIKYPQPIQYPTPAFLMNVNRNNGNNQINNQMNKNILDPQIQRKCDPICGWLCVEGCAPRCCVPG